MISFIHGILSDIEENRIVVEACGVGYSIAIPSSVLSGLPPEGSDIKIYTYYAVKEDSQQLYGFLYKEDRDMFRSLLSVNGVGPKGALAVLSVLRPDDLRMAIITGDAKSISRAQGIGIRTAERVILDLKDKVGNPDFLRASAGAVPAAGGTGAGVPAAGRGRSAGPVAEAMEALTALGYSRSEAGRAVSGVEITEGMKTEEVLRAALKNIRL